MSILFHCICTSGDRFEPAERRKATEHKTSQPELATFMME